MLLLVLVAIALLRDVYLLFRHSVAVGIDGYYYVLQIDSLYAHRGLFFPNIMPVGLYLLAAMRAWTGNPVLALKLGALASHLSLCLGVYVLLKSFTKSHVYALCGVLIITTSNLHAFLLSEFLSNSFALAKRTERTNLPVDSPVRAVIFLCNWGWLMAIYLLSIFMLN